MSAVCSRPGCLCGGKFNHNGAPTTCQPCNGTGRYAYQSGMSICRVCAGVGERDKRRGKTRKEQDKPNGTTGR